MCAEAKNNLNYMIYIIFIVYLYVYHIINSKNWPKRGPPLTPKRFILHDL